MPPRIAPAVPIAPATFANDPGRCGIRTRSVMLYDADGWRARSPGDWTTSALSRIAVVRCPPSIALRAGVRAANAALAAASPAPALARQGALRVGSTHE